MIGAEWVRERLRALGAAGAYGAAVLALVVATGVRWVLQPIIYSGYPFPTYFAAVTLVATLAGRGPALVTLVAGGLIANRLFAPVRSGLWFADAAHWTGFALYFLAGLAIVELAESLRRSRARAEAVMAQEKRSRQVLQAEMAQRKATEESLRRTVRLAGERLREIEAIYQSAPIGLCILDRELRYLRVNERLAQIHGLPVEAHLGRSLREVVPKIADVAEAGLRSAIETGAAALGIELTSETPAHPGVQLTLIESWLPIAADDGTTVGINIVVEDITKRKAAEQALQESEGRLRRALVAGRMVAWDWDPRRDVVRTTENFRDIYGAPAPGSADEGLSLIHPEDRDRHRATVERARGSGGSYESQYRVTVSGGDAIWIEERAEARVDAQGCVDRVVGISTDITQRKRAEEALRAADRRKDQFLAMLAHELRNPLAPMANAVHILRLQARSDGDRIGWATDIIERQTSHLAHLVDDLLDTARIATGRIQLRRRRVELGTLMRQAVDNAHSQSRAKDLKLSVRSPEESVEVDGDADRITQVLSNLLENAVKYTDPGGEVVVSLRREANHAHLSVRDTGIGIDPAELPGVFDLFQQVDSGLDRSKGGLGLGLNLVRRLAEMHGGSVEAHSEGLARGSEFVVRLPIAPAEVGAPRVEAEEGVAADLPRRVLLVEDNPDAAESLAVLLHVLGCEDVRTAATGAAGLQAVEQFDPQVVLLDLGLPDLTGFEVAERIRRRHGPNTLRLIALTGYGREEDRLRSCEAGFDVHLVKPPSMEALMGALSFDGDARPGVAGGARTPAGRRDIEPPL